eukprot:UN05629
MGRMHAPGKGKSRSSLPYQRTTPKWVKQPEKITKEIVTMAKKGLTPSMIGVELRDKQGIPQVRYLNQDTVTRILKREGLGRALPESLYYLIKKAVSLRKHLERNRKDKDAKFRLILIESRIHRTARYYKTAKKLPPTWKYAAGAAAAPDR